MNASAPLTELAGLVTLVHPLLAGLPRMGMALLVIPLLPAGLIPRRLRGGLIIALALPVYPLLASTMPAVDWSAGQWMAYVLKESCIGALIGYSMGLLLWALTCAGELIDVQAGFNNAQIFDPFAGHPAGPVSVLMTQLGVLLFVALGGLHVFLQLLYESLQLWPPSSAYPDLGLAGLRDLAASGSGSLLELATRLAAPVIAVLLIVELGIGLINRAAPQLNAFYFAMPIKAVAALLMLALCLAHLVDVFRSQIEASQGLLEPLDRVWQPR